ncbi:expressed unknown protein [Seminavis robusta]|uniref:Autophagy-related protein 27 n=1 Tax=Seminavis robusta TaxID=568900 RepID=A0A9N8EL98_9STRA|nr:expressed unknown protein [Seminavis robusta]|eukprot:Sro1152_g246880.1 n/a (247) ;mRNA; f:15127-15867
MMLRNSLVAAILLLSPAAISAARYRLRTTTYSMTLATSLDLKNENCRKNFGNDAVLLDMKTVGDQFDNVDDFNEALASVFFNKPTSSFMVTYDGTDVPPGENHDNKCYVVRTTGTSSIDTYGKARVMVNEHEAPILCVVPTEGDTTPKAYVPKEKSSGSGNEKKSRGIWMNTSILLVVLGAFFVVKRRNSGGMPSFSEAYYNILDGKARGPVSATDGYRSYEGHDLGAHLTQGCELSYNPAVQGLV